jgi:hypothetical protein
MVDGTGFSWCIHGVFTMVVSTLEGTLACDF